MTQEQLRGNIKAAGGKFVQNNIEFTIEESSNNIDAKDLDSKRFNASLFDGQEKDWYFVENIFLNEFDSFRSFLTRLCDVMEIGWMGARETVKVERIFVPQELIEEKSNLKGKVEAYEKMLIGRTVSVGQ